MDIGHTLFVIAMNDLNNDFATVCARKHLINIIMYLLIMLILTL